MLEIERELDRVTLTLSDALGLRSATVILEGRALVVNGERLPLDGIRGIRAAGGALRITLIDGRVVSVARGGDADQQRVRDLIQARLARVQPVRGDELEPPEAIRAIRDSTLEEGGSDG